MVERAAVNREAAGSTPALGAEPPFEDIIRARIDAALDEAIEEWFRVKRAWLGVESLMDDGS